MERDPLPGLEHLPSRFDDNPDHAQGKPLIHPLNAINIYNVQQYELFDVMLYNVYIML